MNHPTHPIYLDHNSTTPPNDQVVARLKEWSGLWANPSSAHSLARGPKSALTSVRRQIAGWLNVAPIEIVFTSGGSEGNSAIIKGVFESLKQKGSRNRYVFSEVEHPSIVRSADWLKKQGAEVEWIPCNRDGLLDLEFYESVLKKEDVALVSVMFANNETGSIFPIKKMAAKAHKHGALFHTDAVQIAGKVRFDFGNLNVDYATFAGHKFYALKGAGWTYIKKNVPYSSLIIGGGQERSRRAGTENLLAIASIGEMITQLETNLDKHISHMSSLRDEMEELVEKLLPEVKITGAGAPRLSNTSNFVIDGMDGDTLLMRLDLRGYCVSTGSACSSGAQEPSRVLRAMGLSHREANASVRVSIGWGTTREQIHNFCHELQDAVQSIRESQTHATGSRSDLVQL